MNYQGLMEITKIENIADDVYEMTLKGEGAKYISQPGQFINIKINESLQPYLRRPMSISDYDENDRKRHGGTYGAISKCPF